jgi:signal transduction histidine kinase
MRDITDVRQAEEAIREANEALLESAERFSTLNRISQVVSTAPYMPAGLNIVGKAMADIFRASEVTISLIDSERSTLTNLTHARKLPGREAAVVKVAKGRTIRLEDDAIARHAVSGEQSIILSDRRITPALAEEWERVSSTGVHSLVAVPLRARGNMVGLMRVSSNEAGRSFTSAEVAWMQTIAGSVASAIETARLLAREQQQRIISEGLREVVAALASSLDRETVVRTIFQQLRKVVHYNGAAIYLRKNGKLVIYEGVGCCARYVDYKVPLRKDGPPQQVYKSRQPILIENVAECPQWHIPDPCGDIQTWMGVPLVVGSKAIGTLTLCNSTPGQFTHEDLDILQRFAQHAASALANSLHYEQAHASAVDDERSRLARDLHDSVTQALFSASLIADVLPQLSMDDPARVEEGLKILRRLTRGALAEMRALLLELRPSDLHKVRLDVAIGHLATAATMQSALQIESDLDIVPPLPQKVQGAFYRMAQEALNNIVKHANASNVRVDLHAAPPVAPMDAGMWKGKILLEISDDGRGFRPEVIEDGHIGLSIMRERAKSVRASLLITSTPGAGSKVTASWEDATALKEASRKKGSGLHDNE